MKSSDKVRQPWRLGEECWHSFPSEQPQRFASANENTAVRRMAGKRRTVASAAAHRMRYLRLGPTEAPRERRPPLVLIHGLMGYSFSWRYNMAELARARTVYAVDLLGMGYSDRPAAENAVDFSLRGTARRMLDWLAALELSNVDLVGTSHGGALAMMMAAMDRESTGLSPPGRMRAQSVERAVGRLVLVAPANPWSTAGEKRIAFFNTSLGEWAVRHISPWLNQIALERMYGDPGKITRETSEGYERMIKLPRTSDYGLAVVRSWNEDMEHLEQAVSALGDVPALLLWGTLDRAVAPASAYELKARLPKAEIRMMEGVGHLPYEEAPEEFNQLLLQFLDRSHRD